MADIILSLMKIGEFLRANQLSVGDNALFLLQKLGVEADKLLKKFESEVGETAKMSKSKANVVDPEEAVERYGADTVRLYILFAAPPEQDFEWTDEGIQGAYRFLNRLWNFVIEREDTLKRTHYSREELRELQGRSKDLRRLIHQTIKEYLVDMEKRYQFNTAIAKIMKLLNELTDFKPQNETEEKVLKEGVETLLLLLSPIAPHISEELWHRIGHDELIVLQPVPIPDEDALRVEEVEIPVQINGKVRAKVKVPFGADEETVKEIVLENDRVKGYLDGREVKKFIYINNKLVNIVVK
ncbi:class I tRNA ligase family protein [Hydrogenivirga sp. 128-5-R1-1]|uniref:class I tRNA ligase family protein n=1 Tax=Hydrogenivirga sp. 128-5-R1-1 TaxID=392423 RepID=UPI00015F0BA2|nr:class I tRNA ligase family protein [Hydrogenivirga sp. 128-5-R1-1]EDP74454.1 quinol dehydrogenase membrane component [Hydrogenivirga sp. 128-5-R1-1]